MRNKTCDNNSCIRVGKFELLKDLFILTRTTSPTLKGVADSFVDLRIGKLGSDHSFFPLLIRLRTQSRALLPYSNLTIKRVLCCGR